MKQDEIRIGGRYLARISGKVVPVRVEAIRDTLTARRGPSYTGMPRTRLRLVYDVTNLATGRKTTFRSAAKFRGPAPAEPPVEEDKRTAEARLLRENLEKDAESRDPLG